MKFEIESGYLVSAKVKEIKDGFKVGKVVVREIYVNEDSKRAKEFTHFLNADSEIIPDIESLVGKQITCRGQIYTTVKEKTNQIFTNYRLESIEEVI